MRKWQNSESNGFLWYEFWCTSIQSLHFCKWLWILNWTKWILLVDSITQILNTILIYIYHSLVYIIIHTKEKLSTTNLYFSQKLVRQWNSKEWVKFGLECLLLIFIYSDSNLKLLVKTRTLNASTSGLIPMRNCLKFLTFICHFAFSSEKKNTQTKWPSWMLLNLLLLIKPSDELRNG